METPRHSARRLSPRWCAAALIVGASVLVFLPVLDAGFLNWDDDKNFTTNLHYRGLSLDHLTWMFTTFHYGGYHPLSWLSVAVDHALWGMEPLGYHMTNLSLHAMNCLLIFALFVELLVLTRPRQTSAHIWAACAATLLFAVHPLRVETVAWITERRALLASFFLFLTILLYARSRATDTLRPRLLFGLAVLAYAMSLLSKGMAITLPVLLLVLDVFPLQRRSSWMTRIIEKLPFVILAAVVGFLARYAQLEGAAVRSFIEHPILERCAQTSFGVLFYIWKTLAPTGLCALHPLEQPIDWTRPIFLGSMALTTFITILAWIRRRKHPAPATAWFVYLLLLAPVSGLVQSGPQLVAERYSYIALVPLFALLAGALPSIHTRPRIARSVIPALGVVVLVLAVKSFYQSRDWHDSTSLWTRVTTVHPEGIQGHFNLAAALRADGAEARAAIEFRRCTDRMPAHGSAWYHAGLCSLRTGDKARAIEAFDRALALCTDDASYWLGRPPRAKILYCAGIARVGTAEDAAATGFLRRAITTNAGYVPSYAALADCLDRAGKRADAVRVLRNGLAVAPNDAGLRHKLAQLQAR